MIKKLVDACLCCLTNTTQVSIWGLSKQGKTCKSCGLSVHSKCELNVIPFSHLKPCKDAADGHRQVPAQCTNVHGNYKASEILQSSSSAVSISESRCGCVQMISSITGLTEYP
jgi:hypothetical protein